MTKDQFLSTDFICQLSGAVDRFYNSEAGEFIEGYEHFHNAAGQATVVKAAAEDLGMSCRIVGNEQIPEDGGHMERGSGYDWAVVDNRWIVDLWAVSYGNCIEHALMDMQDPQERDWVISSLGPVESWEELAIDPKEMELARAIWHNFIMPYNAVDDFTWRGDRAAMCQLGKLELG